MPCVAHHAYSGSLSQNILRLFLCVTGTCSRWSGKESMPGGLAVTTLTACAQAAGDQQVNTVVADAKHGCLTCSCSFLTANT